MEKIKNYKLAKKLRICKNKNFQAVYRNGTSYANKMAVIYVMPNKTKDLKIGFAAGKRLGCAVVRNRIKRLLRETYRFNQEKIIDGIDLVFVGRAAMINTDLKTTEKAFLDLCFKAGILKKKTES